MWADSDVDSVLVATESGTMHQVQQDDPLETLGCCLKHDQPDLLMDTAIRGTPLEPIEGVC